MLPLTIIETAREVGATLVEVVRLHPGSDTVYDLGKDAFEDALRSTIHGQSVPVPDPVENATVYVYRDLRLTQFVEVERPPSAERRQLLHKSLSDGCIVLYWKDERVPTSTFPSGDGINFRMVKQTTRFRQGQGKRTARTFEVQRWAGGRPHPRFKIAVTWVVGEGSLHDGALEWLTRLDDGS